MLQFYKELSSAIDKDTEELKTFLKSKEDMRTDFTLGKATLKFPLASKSQAIFGASLYAQRVQGAIALEDSELIRETEKELAEYLEAYNTFEYVKTAQAGLEEDSELLWEAKVLLTKEERRKLFLEQQSK